MKGMTQRLQWLLGETAIDTLRHSSVALFGCGGVGSFTMEALVRSGIGRIVVIDGDSLEVSNLNRQLIATEATLGMRKIDAAKERCLAINSDILVEGHHIVFTRAAYPHFLEELDIHFVVDAVDMVTAKLDIIEQCKELNIPIISSMGTGNKIDPTKLTISDIKKTHTCPLAKVMRKELKKRRISNVPVVFSTELPRTPDRGTDSSSSPGSTGFVPSVAGLMMASYVVRKLTNQNM